MVKRATYKLFVDWANDGNFAGPNDDITDYWLWDKGLSASRGRDRASQLTGRSTAGSLSLVLDNTDSRFSSFNTASPLTGLILPGRKVSLQAEVEAENPPSVGELAGATSATQMPSVSCTRVKFRAAYDNLGRVYIGGSTVTKKNGTTDITTGIELSAGEESEWLPVTNMNVFYRICDNAGDDLTYIALTTFTRYDIWGGFLESIIPVPETKGPAIANLKAQGPIAWLNDPKRTVSVAMQTSIFTGTAFGLLLDAANWPTADRTLDAGQTTMGRWWQGKASPLFGLKKIEDTEAGFLAEGPDRKVRFEDRHHRLKSPHTVSQATYSDALAAALNYLGISQEDPWSEIYNRFEAKVQLYTVGSLAVLWTLAQTGADSPSIPVGGNQIFWASFPNPDSATDAWGVDAWTTPVATTDYTANSLADGSGTNMTGDIAVAVSKLGNDMKITLTNNGTVPAFITLLQARGTPITAADPINIRSEDTASQDKYGVRTYPNPAEFVPNVQEAQSWADLNKSIYADPLPQLAVTLLANVSDAQLTEVLTRDVSDRVTLVANGDAGLGINEDFFVESLEHRITGGIHTLTLDLSPAEDFSDFFVLGTSKLGQTTRLAY